MSYDSVKNGISNLLKGLGFAESTEIVEFKDASSLTYGKAFILFPESGVMDEETSETIVDRFFDIQKWIVKIAFDKNAQSAGVQLDDLNRQKDLILKTLDNPDNWRSYVRIQKYLTWKIEVYDNYYVLVIELKIIDTYTY